MTSAAQHSITAPLSHADVIVLDYLAALWAASDDLLPQVRDELMTAVADHVAMRRGASNDPLDDGDQIGRWLGAPQELAAAARRGRLPAHLRAPLVTRTGAPSLRSSGHADHVGVVLLTVGALALPGISSLAGLMLITGSERWSRAQRAAAWVLAAGTAVTGLLCLLVTVLFQDGAGWFGVGYLSLLSGSMAAGLTLVPGLVTRREPAPHGR